MFDNLELILLTIDEVVRVLKSCMCFCCCVAVLWFQITFIVLFIHFVCAFMIVC